MLSQYINPITFDSKKNHILLCKNKIEWKKQVATVAIKKGLSLTDFITEKILDKFNTFNNIDKTQQPSQVTQVTVTTAKRSRKIVTPNENQTYFILGYFNYTTLDKIIYLIADCADPKIITDLYFNSNIPDIKNINLEHLVNGNIDQKYQA